MKLDIETWGYLPSELNELRFAAIQTLDVGCVNTNRKCVQCSANGRCECTYIHDAISKCGIDNDTFIRMKDWSVTYYQHNPRA